MCAILSRAAVQLALEVLHDVDVEIPTRVIQCSAEVPQLVETQRREGRGSHVVLEKIAAVQGVSLLGTVSG